MQRRFSMSTLANLILEELIKDGLVKIDLLSGKPEVTELGMYYISKSAEMVS